MQLKYVPLSFNAKRNPFKFQLCMNPFCLDMTTLVIIQPNWLVQLEVANMFNLSLESYQDSCICN